jgi:hypothetical protein
MDPTITAAWIGVGGALVGVGIGGWITNRAAVKSLDKAAAQAEAAQQKEWAEDRRRADEDRNDQRRAALLALNWELEVNQEQLDRQRKQTMADTPVLLPHLALDAALRWYRFLPDTARGTVHEAQLALMRYNADAEHLRAALTGPASGLGVTVSQSARGTSARDAVSKSADTALTAFARARSELTKELGL